MGNKGVLLYREAPLRPKAGANRNGLNYLQDEAAEGKFAGLGTTFGVHF